MPVFETIRGNMCIVLPPQPRYTHKPCCTDRAHCTNLGSPNYAANLLAATVRLRGNLKRRLGNKGMGLHWVMDTCCGVLDPESKPMHEKLSSLKNLCAQDGVHLQAEGYGNCAKNIANTVQNLQSGLLGKVAGNPFSAGVTVSGSPARHFWRGFSSPVGSMGTHSQPGWMKSTRDWAYKPPGPYDRRSHKRGGHW